MYDHDPHAFNVYTSSLSIICLSEHIHIHIHMHTYIIVLERRRQTFIIS